MWGMQNGCSVKGCFGIRGLLWFVGAILFIIGVAALASLVIGT